MHPGLMSVVDNVPHIYGDENILRNLTEKGRSWIQQPEKKSLALIQDFVQKFFEPSNSGYGALAGGIFQRTPPEYCTSIGALWDMKTIATVCRSRLQGLGKLMHVRG